MDFADVASFFNNDPVYDAYTGGFLFYCHSKAHNDQTSAGATIRRRTMTTEPDAAMAPRHAVILLGDPWLVGTSTVDGFQGDAVRRTWGLKRSTGLMEVLTPAQACAGVAGTAMHTQKEMYRDMANPHDSSEWDPMWNVYTASGEAVTRGAFIREGTTLFRVRNLYAGIDGLQVLEADEFDSDALQAAVFITAGTPDLVTDRQTTSSVTLQVVQGDSLKFYRYRTQVESDMQPGDRVVFVPAASTAAIPGAELTMLGARWRVLSSVIEADARVLRVRLV